VFVLATPLVAEVIKRTLHHMDLKAPVLTPLEKRSPAKVRRQLAGHVRLPPRDSQ
jgi:hypothetical protein